MSETWESWQSKLGNEPGRCPLCGSNKADTYLGTCADYHAKGKPAHIFHWESTSDAARAKMWGIEPASVTP